MLNRGIESFQNGDELGVAVDWWLGNFVYSVFNPATILDVPLLFMPIGKIGAAGEYGLTRAELREVIGSWSKGSFDTVADSVRYHYSVHGTEQGILNYTHEAKGFLNVNEALSKPHLLKNGEMGIKIRTQDYYGIYTNGGDIVTYGPR